MTKNPQAVLDVLEFYSENLAPKLFLEPSMKSVVDQIEMHKKKLGINPRDSSLDLKVY
jgi:hypothetical protein